LKGKCQELLFGLGNPTDDALIMGEGSDLATYKERLHFGKQDDGAQERSQAN
jgi:hypothetical protein